MVVSTEGNKGEAERALARKVSAVNKLTGKISIACYASYLTTTKTHISAQIHTSYPPKSVVLQLRGFPPPPLTPFRNTQISM